MRRALVGISEQDLSQLDQLSAVRQVSRAELIRQAISMYLEKFKPADQADQAFGLWKDQEIDGLAYQTKLRDEW